MLHLRTSLWPERPTCCNNQHRDYDSETDQLPACEVNAPARSWDGQYGRPSHRGDESIAFSRYGFDEPRIFCVITKRIAQPFNRCIQAVIEIDEGVSRPKLRPELLPSRNLAPVL